MTTKYFTKWVEVVSLSTAIGKLVSLFILNHIIFHYGILSSIVIENEEKFKNKDLRKLCTNLKIKQHWSFIYYPQGSEQDEATNKTLLNFFRESYTSQGEIGTNKSIQYYGLIKQVYTLPLELPHFL